MRQRNETMMPHWSGFVLVILFPFAADPWRQLNFAGLDPSSDSLSRFRMESLPTILETVTSA